MQPSAGVLPLTVMKPRIDVSDRVLAQEFLDGSEAAFRQLYQRYTPRIRGVVLRLLRDAGNVADAANDADEVMQETWLRASAALERFRWESTLSTWLCGIGVHAALEVLRRNRRGVDVEALDQVVATDPPPGEGIDMSAALAALPSRQRAVIVLHDVEGYTHDEIAALLGIVPGTSKSQLTHARNAVRRAIR